MSNEHIESFLSLKNYLIGKGATEDDIQDGLIKILKRNPDFSGRSNSEINNYFISTVINTVIDRKRKNNLTTTSDSFYNFSGELSIIDYNQLSDFINERLKDDFDDLNAKRFLEIYNMLTDVERKYIHCRFYNDMSNAEVARVLNWEVGRPRLIMFRIRRKVLKYYGKY